MLREFFRVTAEKSSVPAAAIFRHQQISTDFRQHIRFSDGTTLAISN
jgi:hypothetical protein